jgi:glycine cleavage system H protein
MVSNKTLMDTPEDLRYTREHEWARIDEKKMVATIGVTDFAQEQLGDVVYVELPEEGAEIKKEQPFGSVESVKAVSDLFAPISGEVVAVNDALADAPEMVNEDPYGEAWMIRVKFNDLGDFENLMDAKAYKKFLESQAEEA